MTTADLLTVSAAPPLAPRDIDELRAWLRLAQARGLAPAALRSLLSTFGSPQAVLAESFAALARVSSDAAARAALAPPAASELGNFETCLARSAEWAAEPGNHIVTLADTAYPPALLTMPDPPPLLYVKGRLAVLQSRGVAMVGSRSATPQGIEDAQRFAHAFSAAGLAVVSGMALGIDTAAHRGALGGAGSTIAVIGTGADLVYPSANRALAHEIAGDGAIISEWPLGTPARAANFPQRNRLIAGLAGGVLVVEAAMRSGSLITARLANEMGRDVFAIPGSIHAPLARGCHRMIKQGAKLVETPGDVLEEFGLAAPANEAQPAAPCRPMAATASWASASVAPKTHTADETRVLDALGHAPATLEMLGHRTDLPGAALQSLLLKLEMSGAIGVLAGGRFVRLTC